MKHDALFAKWFVALLALFLLNACSGLAPGSSELNGTVYPEPRQTPQVALENAAGEAVSLQDFRGKVVPIYFGYTYCPDICPTTMADLARVQHDVDDDGDHMQVLMITVDPQRDTAATVQDYVASFHPTFSGLSGSDEQIDTATEPFGVFYEIAEGSTATGYLVDHTARVFVLDKSGALRVSYAYDTPVDEIAADMRVLIGE